MTLDISDKLESLTEKINKGVLSGSVFLGDLAKIEKHLYNYHPLLKLNGFKLNLCSFKEDSEPIYDNQHVIRCYRLLNRDVIRCYRLLNRDVNDDDKYLKYYLVRVDSENIYSPWDRTDDIDIKDTVELAILAYKRRREILQHATKAAVSAIISRNHSHHIGSHVMPRATVGKIKERLALLYPTLNRQDTILNIINILKSKLDEYIQKKADFTAEIATQPLTTTKVLSFIDHVILGFVNNTLLMDNIGKNEMVCYKDNLANDNRLKFKIKICEKDVEKDVNVTFECGSGCKKHDYCLRHIPYSPYCDNEKEYSRFQIENSSDVEIALPGPLGEYAVFSFLENFIRNGIKHNRKELDDRSDINYEITIALYDLSDDEHYYKISIYDNFTKASKPISWNDEKGKTEQGTLLSYLNYIKKMSIINPDGTTRSEAWGLAEMLIMATLLKGSNDFMKMSDNLDIETNGDCLTYSFKVMKPKKIAIIDSSKKSPENRVSGIWRFDSFTDYMKHIMDSSPAAFEFMVILNTVATDEQLKFHDLRTMMPCRVLLDQELSKKKYFSTLIRGGYKTDSEFKTKIMTQNNSDDRIYENVWEEWIKQYLKAKGMGDEKKPTLVLFFDQEKGEAVTISWINAVENMNTFFNCLILANNEPIILHNKEKLIDASQKNSLVIYDRHAEAFGKVKKVLDNKAQKLNTAFYENYDKNSADFTSIFKEYEAIQVMYELLEASFLKILVLDERISEVTHKPITSEKADPYQSDHEYKNVRSRINVSRRGGIYICTHIAINGGVPKPLHDAVKWHDPQIHTSLRLNKQENQISVKKVFSKDGKVEKEPIEDIDVLIIHQGVLENFFKGTYETKTEYEDLLASLEETIPYVFVDSGRGIPPKLPDHVKFIPFSLLEEYLMKERIAKYSLSKLIMSLYRRKTK